MRELVVTILISGEGIEAAKTEISSDSPDNEDTAYARDWLMYWLSLETRVENTWQQYLKNLPDLSSIAVPDSFSVSFTTKSGPGPYYDDMNAAKAWLEAYNQLLTARSHLARAKAYKALEAQDGEYSNQRNVTHLRKMDHFHLALRNIKKVEDMMIRLIFEGLGASLNVTDPKTGSPLAIVDITYDEWERKLTLEKLKPALKERSINQRLKDMDNLEYEELRQIVSAMNHRATQQMHNFWQYRHKLEHRMPQSVDYPKLYPVFEDRPKPVEIDGKIVLQGFIGSQPINADWTFDDLYNTAVTVYTYYLKLLERLNKLPTFGRPK